MRNPKPPPSPARPLPDPPRRRKCLSDAMRGMDTWEMHNGVTRLLDQISSTLHVAHDVRRGLELVANAPVREEDIPPAIIAGESAVEAEIDNLNRLRRQLVDLQAHIEAHPEDFRIAGDDVTGDGITGDDIVEGGDLPNVPSSTIGEN